MEKNSNFNKINILGITLARGGSKGIKDKNIKKINNKPLIAYTIEEAIKSKYLTNYIVSTDSEKIRRISKRYKAEVPFLRPKKYASDKSKSVDALIHAVKWIEKNEQKVFDYVIEIMCTNPLKTVKDIDNVIYKLITTNSDSVIAMHRIQDHHPSRIKKIVKDKIVNFCVKEKPESRRQDLKPHAYIRSGSIYGLKRNFLINKKLRYGSKNSRPYILPELRAINIDTKFDYYIAEKLLKNAK